jgi:hypothetical protein
LSFYVFLTFVGLLFVATVCIIFSICWSIFRQWKLKLPETRKQQRERLRQERLDAIRSQPHGVAQYELDYALNPVYEQFLFDEYLEMGRRSTFNQTIDINFSDPIRLRDTFRCGISTSSIFRVDKQHF